MKTIKHKIKIGDEVFSVEVRVVETKEGEAFLDTDDLIRAQRKLALQLIDDRKDTSRVSPELFNFLVNISGMRAREIAEYVSVEPGNISQWRKEKGLSALAWQTFRVFFSDLFINSQITNDIFIRNAGGILTGTRSERETGAAASKANKDSPGANQSAWLENRDEYKAAKKMIRESGSTWGPPRKKVA